MKGNMVRLVATEKQAYLGKQLEVGDKFEAAPDDAEDLIIMKLATRSEKRTYKRRDMVPEK